MVLGVNFQLAAEMSIGGCAAAGALAPNITPMAATARMHQNEARWMNIVRTSVGLLSHLWVRGAKMSAEVCYKKRRRRQKNRPWTRRILLVPPFRVAFRCVRPKI